MLLIFDCDGVVLDSMALHNEVESEAYAKYGLKIEPSVLSARFAGMPLIETFRVLEKESGMLFPDDAEAEVDRRKEEVFSERLTIIPGITETLDALDGIPRCIASGSRMAQLRHGLTLTKLYDRFAPNIFSSELVAHGKPAPDLFLYAAAQMRARARSCLVIEDGVSGVIGARAAGMRVLGFVGGTHCRDTHSDGKQSERLLAAGAELVFSDMTELVSIVHAASQDTKKTASRSGNI